MDLYNQVKEVTVNQQPIIYKGELLRLGLGHDSYFDEKTRTITIMPEKESGVFVSPIMETTSFSRLIASWNALTPPETSVECLVRVEVEGSWSKFFSYGEWALGRQNKSMHQEDELATFSIDTLTIKGNKANRVQFQVNLKRDDYNLESPQLKLVTLTLDTNQMDFRSFYSQEEEVVLPVPEISQMLVPEIGNSICSPTSVTMVLNYRGLDLKPEKVAELAKDYGSNVYGNWSYNVAVAGALGREAYVSFLRFEDVKKYLREGQPVVASITVKSSDELDHLPLRKDGSGIMTYPSGHLLVIRGFTTLNGRDVVLVNDPAAPSEEEVSRYYDLDQFLKVWKKVGYIIQ